MSEKRSIRLGLFCRDCLEVFYFELGETEHTELPPCPNWDNPKIFSGGVNLHHPWGGDIRINGWTLVEAESDAVLH